MSHKDAGEDIVTVLVGQLCRYLRTNPQACDTTNGIARWWLGTVPALEPQVQLALDYLEHEGLIEGLNAADGRRRYRRPDAVTHDNDARLDAIASPGRRLH